jgi:hypothetical protein
MGLLDPEVGGTAILYSVTLRDTASHPGRLESRGGIHVLWGVKLIQFLEPCLRRRPQNYVRK